MGRAWGAYAAGLALAGCAGRAELSVVVPVEAGTESVLVAFVSGRDVELHARPAGAPMRFPALALAGDGEVDVVVLEYAETLEVLEIAAGRVPLAGTSDAQRPIPAFQRAHRARISGAKVAPFAPLAALEAPLSEARLLAHDRAACLDGGGCYPGGGFCVPCPEPPVPLEPDPPEPPEPPRFTAPDPPAEPAPPVLLPCPPGWMERGDVVDRCEPLPPPPVPCGEGETQLPGDAACAPIAGVCPPGAYAADLPASGVLYVSAAALPGGDGSMVAPFATIAEAMGAAAPGDTIAVARGVYREHVELAEGVTLAGACRASELAPLDPQRAAVLADGTRASVRGFLVRSPGDAVVAIGAELELAQLEIETARGGIVAYSGATMQVQDVSVRGARCAVCMQGAAAIVDRGVFEGSVDESVAVRAGGSLVLTRVIVRDTTTDLAEHGTGVVAVNASLELERSLLEGQAGAAMYLYGTTATVADVVIARTLLAPTGHGAAVISDHADLVLRRVWIEEMSAVAVNLHGPGAVRLEDVGVARTRSALNDGGVTAAVRLVNGLRSRLARVLVTEAGERGVVIAGGRVDAADLQVVDGTSTATVAQIGMGMWIRDAATFDGARMRFADCDGGCLMITSTDTIARISDLDLSSRAGAPDRASTLLVAGAARLELERARIHTRGQPGLYLFDRGTSAEAVDVHVFNDAPAYAYASCFTAQRGGVLRLSRIIAEGCTYAGLIAAEHGSELVVEDAFVRDVSEQPEGGFGLFAGAGARLLATRAEIERATTYGAGGSGAAELSLADVAFRDTREGELVALGAGISATNVDLLSIRRATATGGSSGVYIAAARGAGVPVHDVAVSAMRRTRANEGGSGISIRASAVDLRRLDIRDVDAVGLTVAEDTDLNAESVRIEDTRNGGATFYQRSHTRMARVLVRHATTTGIRCEDVGSELEITELRITETRLPVDGSFALRPSAADARDGGTMTLSRFLLDDNATFGFTLVAGRGRLNSGAVTGNNVGVALFSTPIDVRDLLDGVRVERNGTTMLIE